MSKLKFKYEYLAVFLIGLYSLSLVLQHSRLSAYHPPIVETPLSTKEEVSNKRPNAKPQQRSPKLKFDKKNYLVKHKPDDLAPPKAPTKHPKITDPNDPRYDKEKVIEMLTEMGVEPFSIDNATWAQVPTWTQVTDIWGTKPVVQGLDKHCPAFRAAVPAKFRHVAVAGIFSTGTNLLAQLMQHNCGIPERIEWLGRRLGHGMEWQVPYGKHNPYRYREKHQVKEFLKQQKRRGAKLEHYLPVATIRDPYDWFGSICRHPYTFRWPHNAKNCPHMVRNNGKPIQVKARFGASGKERIPFPSLAHVWNEFYGEYFRSEHPAIMVRFEDLIFFPREVTQIVCECAGGRLLKPHQVYSDKEASSGGSFHYVIGSSLVGPGHGKSYRNGLLDAWIKYATPRTERQGKLPKIDVDFSEKVLDKDIVQAFEYNR